MEGMNATQAANNAISDLDTILTLPRGLSAMSIANEARDTGLSFINESTYWGKAQLALWLMGPFEHLSRHAAAGRARSGVTRKPIMLRDIDARVVDRVIATAREEVLQTLGRLSDPHLATEFVYGMLAANFVLRCEDARHAVGWVPTGEARRLADHVLSLFAVDLLCRPEDYEHELFVCPACENVVFDAGARDRGVCFHHSSIITIGEGPSTLPDLPEGA